MSAPDLDLERRLASLRDLLRSLFDADQLRRLLHELGPSGELADELPGPAASAAQVRHEATILLHRARRVDAALFEAMRVARPGARLEIERVARMWTVDLAGASSSLPAEPPARTAPAPIGADDLNQRVNAELRELRSRLALARARGLPTASIEQSVREKTRALRAGPTVAAGDVLAEGRYLLIERLGSGGYAVVWRAWDEETRREVAIKVLHGELARDPQRVDRFLRGARIMQSLEHPHIARICEAPRHEAGHRYVVMELLTGGDLHRRVIEGTLERGAALDAALAAGEALQFAHERGVVHRDVKPHNILLDEGGWARLTDFDLGRVEGATRDTATQSSMGTLLYAAPEALGNAREVGPEGDVASLAMTVAFCVFGAELPPESLYRRDNFIEELDCNEPLRAVIARGAAHRPRDRFASARDFVEAARAAIRGPALPVAPASPVEQALVEPQVAPELERAPEIPEPPVVPAPLETDAAPAAIAPAAAPVMSAPSAPTPRPTAAAPAVREGVGRWGCLSWVTAPVLFPVGLVAGLACIAILTAAAGLAAQDLALPFSLLTAGVLVLSSVLWPGVARLHPTLLGLAVGLLTSWVTAPENFDRPLKVWLGPMLMVAVLISLYFAALELARARLGSHLGARLALAVLAVVVGVAIERVV